MLTWVFIFLGAVDLTAVLILIGLAIATLEEICRREVTNKMRWRDPDPGRDGRSVEHGKEIKRSFMSRTELRNKEAEKWFRRKPYSEDILSDKVQWCSMDGEILRRAENE